MIQRKQRALKQIMYLLNVQHDIQHKWVFKIEGYSGSVYYITLLNNSCSCTCPDYKQRHTICKHIYFIIGRVANCYDILDKLNNNPHEFILNKQIENGIINSVLKHQKDEIKQDNNEEDEILNQDINEKEYEDCGICFESLDNGKLVSCNVCKKELHYTCMKRWWKHKYTCPLCRSSFKPSIKEQTIKSNDLFKYFQSSDTVVNNVLNIDI